MSEYLFTSESVGEGHPDKVSDQISDAILDAILSQDKHSRVAAETLCNTGLVILAGEITTSANVDYIQVARDTIKRIGYDDTEYGIDTIFYDPTAKFKKLHPVFPDPLIVFTGQMDYRPNIEAVSDFARNALPAIREAHPEATFAIVGRNPRPAVVELSAQPGVQVTGAVDDVRTWLAGADVVVAPLRIARGIQNKVLEAMAMAKPVVASTAAAEGIDAVDGEHLLVASKVSDEAAKVCALLADTDERLRLGAAARAHVIAHYGWDAQLALLKSLMEAGAAK